MFNRRPAVLLCFVVLVTTQSLVVADVFNCYTGELIQGTRPVTPGPEADLSELNLPYADLRSVNLRDALLIRTNVFGACFQGSRLDDANLTSFKPEFANFTNASIDSTNFTRTAPYGLANEFTADQLYTTANYRNGNLQGINFSSNSLRGWDFSGQDLGSANFTSTNLLNSQLRGANLTTANLSSAKLSGVSFANATINGANLSRTRLYGRGSELTEEQLSETASYVQGDLGGVNFSGNNLARWDFAGKILINSNLSFTNLYGVDLTGSPLRDANLSFSKFTDGKLEGADIRGADFSGAARYGAAGEFGAEQLYTTRSYQDRALQEINLSGNTLNGWDFTQQDLTGADFTSANLVRSRLRGAILRDADLTATKWSGVDLTGADIAGADFSFTRNFGADGTGELSEAQLRSTASYQNGDLTGISMRGNSLVGWDLRGMSLQDVNFEFADLLNTDLTLCDLRGSVLSASQGSVAKIDNAILPSGVVNGLSLAAGERLVVRDAESGVEIRNSITLADSATLQVVLLDSTWESTINVPSSTQRNLGGTLSIDVPDDVDIESLVGTTFQLFDWNSIAPTDNFDSIEFPPSTQWDVSDLYTTGEVRLTSAAPRRNSGVLSAALLTSEPLEMDRATASSVPEPTALPLAVLGFVILATCRSRAPSTVRRSTLDG